VNLRKDHYRIVKSYIISILGSICLLDAVSALRNPVAPKDLAENSGVFPDRGNCEAKNPGRVEH
jgi:hypothetical protein